MADKPERHQKRSGAKAIETIDLSISDEDDTPTAMSVRGMAVNASNKRRVLNSGSGSGSGTQIAHRQEQDHTISTTKPDAAVSPVDVTSSHSGSQLPRPRSQQQSLRVKSSAHADKSTLAQRVATRASDGREQARSRPFQRVRASSSGRGSSPPASQVQISRGLNGTGSAMSSQITSANGSLGASGKSYQRKRSLECDGETEQQPTAKKSRFGRNSSGTGEDVNPIVISDSPPPRAHPKKIPSHSLPGTQRTPKQSRANVFGDAGKMLATSSPTSKSASISRRADNRRAGFDDSIVADKSPTIPESLPGSPNVDKATVVQHTNLPLFIPPSDKVLGEDTGNEVESFSTLADQAGALIASQPDDTYGFATPMQGINPDDIATALQAPSGEGPDYHSAAALTSATQAKFPSVAQERIGRSEAPLGDQTAGFPPAVRPAARSLPDSPPRNEVPKNTTTADFIEQIINKYMQELRGDNIYWTRTWLKRARQMVPAEVQRNTHGSTSVFRDMKPIEPVRMPEGKKTTDVLASFTTETFNGGGKSTKRAYSIPCTLYHTPTDADVPNYSHFVNIQHSFLAQNETVLRHWPYFGDDFDIQEAPELEEHYYTDVIARERKIKRLAQAENSAEYVEDMLRDIDCTWSDVLRFLLDPKPNVGNVPGALAALRNRDKFCDEDFVRGGQRWTTVLSRLPPSNDPDKVGRAALLCEYFQKIAKFQLWHVARRSDLTASLLQEEDPKLDLNEITCRICMRFNCPYHGEIHETRSGGSDSERDGSAEYDAVETDIIHPYRVNYRSRVKFPPSVDTEDSSAEIDSKSKKVEYWHKRSLNHYPDDRRGPFYPCYHPGTTCEKSQCSCFVDRIPCEKSCACPPSCKRKWQGCDCRRRGGSAMICFEDSRCACFQLGRECDADLCGDCGVADVLDPVHRHDDMILQGRCHNASIQRGVPRHTILGDSGIHGLGLYACEDIDSHDFVGEYKGEVITKYEAERRGAVYEHQKLSYLFTLNKKQEVDSSLFGNKVRFINHAADKQANLYPRIIMVNTVFRIALYGKRKIKAGQELLFDYGDQFPQDQLGGKANKERKAAPHLRNKNLVKEFDDVVEETDKFGNRRARKAAGSSKRGKPSFKGSIMALTEASSREGSTIARKSTGPPPDHGGARSGAVRPPRDRATYQEDVEEALHQGPLKDMDDDAGQRLRSYNLAPDGDDEVSFHRDDDDDDDDDFTPHGGHRSNDRKFDETSSIDGDHEDDGEGDDAEAESAHTRARSSRFRNVKSRRR